MGLRTFEVYAIGDGSGVAKYKGTVSAKNLLEAKNNACSKYSLKPKKVYVEYQK